MTPVSDRLLDYDDDVFEFIEARVDVLYRQLSEDPSGSKGPGFYCGNEYDNRVFYTTKHRFREEGRHLDDRSLGNGWHRLSLR
jgi:hypothetical protein